jgi:DNA-binding NarL/FixJ family response regulator
MKRARVLLADDHKLVADLIGKLLVSRFELVGRVENGRELLDVAARLRPDVVLLDISLPVLNGIDAANRLRETVPDARIVFLSMHADPLYVSRGFRAGGRGYVTKSSAASELVFAIEEVLKGRHYVASDVAEALDGTELAPRQVPHYPETLDSCKVGEKFSSSSRKANRRRRSEKFSRLP